MDGGANGHVGIETSATRGDSEAARWTRPGQRAAHLFIYVDWIHLTLNVHIACLSKRALQRLLELCGSAAALLASSVLCAVAFLGLLGKPSGNRCRRNSASRVKWRVYQNLSHVRLLGLCLARLAAPFLLVRLAQQNQLQSSDHSTTWTPMVSTTNVNTRGAHATETVLPTVLRWTRVIRCPCFIFSATGEKVRLCSPPDVDKAVVLKWIWFVLNLTRLSIKNVKSGTRGLFHIWKKCWSTNSVPTIESIVHKIIFFRLYLFISIHVYSQSRNSEQCFQTTTLTSKRSNFLCRFNCQKISFCNFINLAQIMQTCKTWRNWVSNLF